jgi:hypothetical protein
MEILKTFIVYSTNYHSYVKLHHTKQTFASSSYFIETSEGLEPISTSQANELLNQYGKK